MSGPPPPSSTKTELKNELRSYFSRPFNYYIFSLKIGKDLVTYVPILTTLGLGIYVAYKAFQPKIGIVNPNIEKSEAKVTKP